MGIHFVRKADVKPNHGQTQGMVRMTALSDVSDHACSLVMVSDPHSESGVHHHGEQDTLIYCSRGKGALIFNGGKEKITLTPGDWACIPAYEVHQEANIGDEEFELIITRTGRTPKTVNLDGWPEK